MVSSIQKIVDSKAFQWSVVGVILANAIILGLLTKSDLSQAQIHTLEFLDNLCLVVFCIEIVLKLIVLRHNFFRDGWNVFDFIVVAIALAPATGELSVLRSLRVLRLMRLATTLPSMRRVVTGMFKAVPGAASVAGVLLVMYYVAAVMGTNFFRETNPDLFGGMGASLFTLFKMMTLEGWPDIADQVLEHKPTAWPFFVIFIIFTTFTTLNLLFGIIVGAMEEAKEEDAREKMSEKGVEIPDESNEVRLATIENDVKVIREILVELRNQSAAAPAAQPAPAAGAAERELATT